MRLYGEIIDRTGIQTMLFLTCTMVSSVEHAHYRIPCAKDWVSVDCCIKIYKDTFNVLVSFKMNFR